jgi:hypothetical protein
VRWGGRVSVERTHADVGHPSDLEYRHVELARRDERLGCADKGRPRAHLPSLESVLRRAVRVGYAQTLTENINFEEFVRNA